MQMYLSEISTAMSLFCQYFHTENPDSKGMPAPRMANDLAVALGEPLRRLIPVYMRALVDSRSACPADLSDHQL